LNNMKLIYIIYVNLTVNFTLQVKKYDCFQLAWNAEAYMLLYELEPESTSGGTDPVLSSTPLSKRVVPRFGSTLSPVQKEAAKPM